MTEYEFDCRTGDGSTLRVGANSGSVYVAALYGDSSATVLLPSDDARKLAGHLTEMADAVERAERQRRAALAFRTVIGDDDEEILVEPSEKVDGVYLYLDDDDCGASSAHIDREDAVALRDALTRILDGTGGGE